MDIATLVGIIAGTGVIVGAIMLGGSLGAFVDVPSIMVVFGGTAAATLIKFPMRDVVKSMKTGIGIAFKNPKEDPQSIYEKAMELSALVRKNGLLGLESVEIENEVMKRGIRMCVDGHNGDVIRSSISSEVAKSIQRDELGELMFRGIGDTAPAFGMIGTLVGLVQMLANLSDPDAIGPAMAIAMLTTFYGAVLANLIALPIADKLALKVEQLRNTKELIVESVVQIQASQSPMVMKEILGPYLPGGIPVDDGAGEGGDA
ncbi:MULTISPECIES: motility protein A [unclassified Thalassospira]|jgi:chemotaxis protein MotA|uniref:motility protein A n=1 Tax=unclassified Thalassospira TaxID=2648997 RepID=UPI000A1E7323|nr:MotA/TolQ/ExbB proton channel family protein [Thalassospira sp. MCCC 1A01428]OSQ46504.1 flagellar motor protein PomA [Thalassospira sp. MCCC 1A01428]